MAVNTTSSEYITLELQDGEDTRTIKNATNAIKNGFVNYYSTTKEEEDFTTDYEKILKLTAVSIKNVCKFLLQRFSCFRTKRYRPNKRFFE